MILVFINGLLFCLLSRKFIRIAHFPFLPLSVNWSSWKGSCESKFLQSVIYILLGTGTSQQV